MYVFALNVSATVPAFTQLFSQARMRKLMHVDTMRSNRYDINMYIITQGRTANFGLHMTTCIPKLEL